MAATPTVNLGFLTVLHDANGFMGGYLVTNTWGRPLEFRHSTAVQPNRVQQALYAATLRPYICADLIGKTLVEKAAVSVRILLTDTEDVLDLRHKVEVPVVWVNGPGVLKHHPRYPEDEARLCELLEGVKGLIDLVEPFGRIREAINEARKMGVSPRAG